ncbi:MAG: alpha/beta fold hydrolase [Nonlabens sp.]
MNHLLLVISILFSYAYSTAQIEVVSHKVFSNNVEIHYTTVGHGMPMLIINGGPGFSSEGFLPLAKQIGKFNIQAILFDQRGTGKSKVKELSLDNISLDLMVEDIEAIRKDLGIKQWIILGHSFGGMLAGYYTSKHPKSTQGIIFSSSGGLDLDLLGNSSNGIESNLTAQEVDSLNYWRARHNESQNTKDRDKFHSYLARAYVLNPKYYKTVADRLGQGNRQLNRMVWQSMQNKSYDVKDELTTYEHPVIILHGEKDIVARQVAETTHSVFKNSGLVFLDNTAHYGWLDNPDKYFTSIEDYLNRIDEYKVRRVLRDYVQAIYKADTTLVHKITSTSLQKSGHFFSKKRQSWSYSNMNFQELVETANTYNRKKWLPDWAPIDITIYDINEKVASAKVKAIWGFDYVLLSRDKIDNWKMDKILWQSYSPEEEKSYLLSIKNKYNKK